MRASHRASHQRIAHRISASARRACLADAAGSMKTKLRTINRMVSDLEHAYTNIKSAKKRKKFLKDRGYRHGKNASVRPHTASARRASARLASARLASACLACTPRIGMHASHARLASARLASARLVSACLASTGRHASHRHASHRHASHRHASHRPAGTPRIGTPRIATPRISTPRIGTLRIGTPRIGLATDVLLSPPQLHSGIRPYDYVNP